MITVPPRHLKSVTASVAFVAWVLGHDPAAKIMVASYSQDLARHHSNQTRMIMESEWYKSDFPHTRISDRGNRALELETTAGGVRKAVSVSGSITGFGADIIIVDDCMKADEARSPTVREELRNWFDNTLSAVSTTRPPAGSSRSSSGSTRMICPPTCSKRAIGTSTFRRSPRRQRACRDRTGSLHASQCRRSAQSQRAKTAKLDQLRRDLGPAVFSAQYQQEPVTAEGNMIRLEWFGTYDEVPDAPRIPKGRAELGHRHDRIADERLLGLHDVGLRAG